MKRVFYERSIIALLSQGADEHHPSLFHFINYVLSRQLHLVHCSVICKYSCSFFQKSISVGRASIWHGAVLIHLQSIDTSSSR